MCYNINLNIVKYALKLWNKKKKQKEKLKYILIYNITYNKNN